MKTKPTGLFGDDPTDLEKQNQALYNALAKMWLWQAGVGDFLPEDLTKEVNKLLGDKMATALVCSEEGESFETIAARVHETQTS